MLALLTHQSLQPTTYTSGNCAHDQPSIVHNLLLASCYLLNHCHIATNDATNDYHIGWPVTTGYVPCA